MSNRSERRNWDKYVATAREVKSEIDLPDGETLIVYIPSAEQIEGIPDGDVGVWVEATSLLGEENAEKLRAVSAGVPVTAIRDLLRDVMIDLGMSGDDSGN